MKQIILMMSGTFIAILVFGILFSLQQREIRKTKLENTCTEIMKEYMERGFWDLSVKNQSDEEFEEYFESALKKRVSEEAIFDVCLIIRDMTEGILGLKVTEEYTHINGDTGKLEVERFLVLEEEEDL